MNKKLTLFLLTTLCGNLFCLNQNGEITSKMNILNNEHRHPLTLIVHISDETDQSLGSTSEPKTPTHSTPIILQENIPTPIHEPVATASSTLSEATNQDQPIASYELLNKVALRIKAHYPKHSLEKVLQDFAPEALNENSTLITSAYEEILRGDFFNPRDPKRSKAIRDIHQGYQGDVYEWINYLDHSRNENIPDFPQFQRAIKESNSKLTKNKEAL